MLDVKESEGELPVHEVVTLVVMKNELHNANSNPEGDLSGFLYGVANVAVGDFGIGQKSRDQTVERSENARVLRRTGLLQQCVIRGSTQCDYQPAWVRPQKHNGLHLPTAACMRAENDIEMVGWYF